MLRRSRAGARAGRIPLAFTLVAAGVLLAFTLVAVAHPLASASAGPPWSRSHTAVVWLKPGATEPQIAAIGARLARTSSVSGCAYRSQLTDYLRAEKLLPNAAFEDPIRKTTPANFQCNLRQPRQRGNLVRMFVTFPAVLEVTVPDDTIRG